MRKLWVLLVLALGCWAQERQNVFIVIPDPTGATSGHIEFLDAASGHKTTFRSASGLAADLNYIWPPADAHGCVVSDGAGNLSVDPTCSSGTSAAPFTDAAPLIKNGTDATKLVQFDVSSVPTMTTYHLTVPGLSGTSATLALLERVQSFTAFSTFNVGAGIGTNGGQLIGGPITLHGETSINGNVVLQPGNVATNSSVVVENPRLDGPGLYVVDASGTTTGNGLELRTNGGALYFKVIGGTDAGAPGTVVTRGVVPFSDNTYLSGNSGHSWSDVYSYNGDFAPAGIVGNYVNIRKLNVNDSAGGTVFWDIQTHIVGGGNTSELVARDNAGTPTLSLIRQLSGATFNNAVFDLNVIASTGNTYSLGSSGIIWSALWTGTGNFASDATFQANLLAAADNVSNIGNPSGNRFGVVAAHNADFAPPGTTGNYVNIRKLNVNDENGGTTFWDIQTDASGSSNSQMFIRDNAGTPVLSLVRDLSGVNWNHAILDMNLIPTATASHYTIGESGYRWANGYFTDLNITGTCTGCIGSSIYTMTGTFNNTTYEAALETDTGASVTPATDRVWITNLTGQLSTGFMSDVKVPLGATSFEANAVSGQIFCGSVSVNCVAGSFFGVADANNTDVWGLNTLASDGQPGRGGAPHFTGVTLRNEFDFNVFDTSTQVYGVSVGGASAAQPTTAYGFVANTLGSGISWTCAYCSLDGVSPIALQAGTRTSGNGTGSQNIILYSRDSGGVVHNNSISADQNGSTIFTYGGVGQYHLFLNSVGGQIAAIGNGQAYMQGIAPDTTLAWDLGSSTLLWSSLWVKTLKGQTSTNGNIILQAGNVAANSSVVIENPRLDGPSLYAVDAAGTTTGNGFELRTNSNTVYFKVIGGTDAGAPGTVVTKDIVSFANNTYDLGKSVNRWNNIYANNLDVSGTCTGCGSAPFTDASALIFNASDPTKLVKFDVSAISSGSTFTIAVPGTGSSGTLPFLGSTQTWSHTQTFGAGTGGAIFPSGSTVNINSGSTFNCLGTGCPATVKLYQVPSGDLAPLTGTYTDVPGASVTLPSNGTYEIRAVMNLGANCLTCTSTIGFVLDGQLVVNGIAQPNIAQYVPVIGTNGVQSQATVTQTWLYTNSSGSVTAKLQAKMATGTSVGDGSCFQNGTSIFALLLN